MLSPQASCLPITALQALQCDQKIFLLVGQGPWLRIYDQAGIQNVCEPVFEAQPIQGFEVIPEQPPQTVSHRFKVIIWGGRWVRYGVLSIGSNEPEPSLSKPTLNLKSKFDAQDWVLKVASFHLDEPRSSLTSTTTTFMLTSHNTLLEVSLRDLIDSELQSYNAISKVQGPQSFLYSGDIKVVEANHLIIASGTVFGEIITWTCQRATPSAPWLPVARRRYNGHRGSIFGVAISQPLTMNGNLTRLMASCSDDRTIRIWDISDCDQASTLIKSNSLPVRTGFGNTGDCENLQLAATWGHTSRIWNIVFDIKQTTAGKDEVFIISRGEDATCQLWTLQMGIEADQLFVLQPVTQDRHHNGKNIWSLAQIRIQSSLRVYTGGADGQLVLRTVGNGETFFMRTSKSFKDITGSATALRHYTLLTHEDCLATTDYGELFLLSSRGLTGPLSWIKILDSDPKMSVITCHLRRRNLVLLGRQNGSLAILQLSDYRLIPISPSLQGAISWIDVIYQPGPAEGLATCMLACLVNRQAFILWLPATAPSKIEIVSLKLPETFTVTASCYDPAASALILGSRAGALALYLDVTQGSKPTVDPFCFRHVHGENCITSIKILRTEYEPEPSFNRTIHILTTGRDGCYAIHCIKWDFATGVYQPQFSTLHLSSPPFGPNVEGSYFTSNRNLSGTKTLDLVLYGFRSTSFVVWNETQQSTIFSVDCGGSHRSWSYTDSNDQTGSEALQTTDETSVLQEAVRTFAWTKAGNFNRHTVQGSNHTSIIKGGHGREIKAVAGCSRLYRCNSRNLPIVATGAEDTNIQLFALSTGQRKASSDTVFMSLAVLKGHTTGLQHLHFSSSGRYLFSSAGCEEFYVWKLTFEVPCIGVGVVLQDQLRKDDEDSDARIMSFDLKDISDEPSVGARHEIAFLITLAYSNGKAKIIKYTPAPERKQGRFETMREIPYGSFCLMQAFLLSHHTQTDTGFMKSNILSAGTNGILNISTFNLDDARNAQPSIEVHRVHQSSILSMDAVSLGQSSWLAATGGDDNGLGLTVISRATIPPAPSEFVKRSLCIPKAHAAALTALKIVTAKRTTKGFNVTVITVGNDQRIKVWEVEVSDSFLDGSKNELLDGFEVKKLRTAWTAVADVSAVELVEDPEQTELHGYEHGHGHQMIAPKKSRIMIVGVGMELLDVDLNSN